MRKRLFKENITFFHVNIDFICHSILKELDWIFVQKKIAALLAPHRIQLYALVMMDTHIHLLIQSDLRKENFFCEELGLQLSKNETSTPWHCEPILNYPQFLNAYKYIYRNPVEAGLAENTEDYAYSTLRSLLGKSASYCQIIDHMGLVQNPYNHLNWLNNKELFRFSRLGEFQSDVSIAENANRILH